MNCLWTKTNPPSLNTSDVITHWNKYNAIGIIASDNSGKCQIQFSKFHLFSSIVCTILLPFKAREWRKLVVVMKHHQKQVIEIT